MPLQEKRFSSNKEDDVKTTKTHRSSKGLSLNKLSLNKKPTDTSDSESSRIGSKKGSSYSSSKGESRSNKYYEKNSSYADSNSNLRNKSNRANSNKSSLTEEDNHHHSSSRKYRERDREYSRSNYHEPKRRKLRISHDSHMLANITESSSPNYGLSSNTSILHGVNSKDTLTSHALSQIAQSQKGLPVVKGSLGKSKYLSKKISSGSKGNRSLSGRFRRDRDSDQSNNSIENDAEVLRRFKALMQSENGSSSSSSAFSEYRNEHSSLGNVDRIPSEALNQVNPESLRSSNDNVDENKVVIVRKRRHYNDNYDYGNDDRRVQPYNAGESSNIYTALTSHSLSNNYNQDNSLDNENDNLDSEANDDDNIGNTIGSSYSNKSSTRLKLNKRGGKHNSVKDNEDDDSKFNSMANNSYQNNMSEDAIANEINRQLEFSSLVDRKVAEQIALANSLNTSNSSSSKSTSNDNDEDAKYNSYNVSQEKTYTDEEEDAKFNSLSNYDASDNSQGMTHLDYGYPQDALYDYDDEDADDYVDTEEVEDNEDNLQQSNFIDQIEIHEDDTQRTTPLTEEEKAQELSDSVAAAIAYTEAQEAYKKAKKEAVVVEPAVPKEKHSRGRPRKVTIDLNIQKVTKDKEETHRAKIKQKKDVQMSPVLAMLLSPSTLEDIEVTEAKEKRKRSCSLSTRTRKRRKTENDE